MTNVDPKKIDELLERGVEEVIDKEHLRKKLLSGKQLRIKLGIDPTSPNLHIGRSIPLLKLKDFQNLGHKVVLIIGDGTGVIGDTSDKDSERPMLAAKTIKENLKTYTKQAGKILDIRKCEIKYNSSWLNKLGYNEIGEHADQFSLHEMIARENIKKRLDEGKRISLREVLYPLMQGYDSVAIKSDVELGGTDQRFNLLAGRTLQKSFGQEPQDVMMNPLIEGTDGRKMSSSWGNTINLVESPQEMFGKAMSIPDNLIVKYFILVTRVPLQKIDAIRRMPNPRDQKAELAKEIVRMYHGEIAANKAEEEFNKTFRDKELPSDIEVFETEHESFPILDLLVNSKLVDSKKEAKRLVEGGAVKKIIGSSEVKLGNWQEEVNIEDGMVVKVGNRRFVKIKLTK
jgi:tyrosyl-tRNA synthetase